MTAFILLGALLVRLPVSAQDVAPSAAVAEPEPPVPLVDATTAPPPASAQSRPTVAFVAPGAPEIAWQELHEIQQREQQIWNQPPPTSVAWPVVGLSVGATAFTVMLPLGSIRLLNARYGGTEAGEIERDEKLGGTLVFLGVLGLVAAIASSVALGQIRKRRARREAEIKTLTDRRTLLENLLEAQLYASHAQRAP